MSGSKDSTWLPTFCVMLVFAMVLEEVQCTIQIQADTEVQKLKVSSDEAQLEARNACGRIDSQFSLLTNLCHRKYRDKTWKSEGSFGPQTPLLQDPAAHKFCINLRHLLLESGETVLLLSLFAVYNGRVHYGKQTDPIPREPPPLSQRHDNFVREAVQVHIAAGRELPYTFPESAELKVPLDEQDSPSPRVIPMTRESIDCVTICLVSVFWSVTTSRQPSSTDQQIFQSSMTSHSAFQDKSGIP
jgi:hypothetical protein